MANKTEWAYCPECGCEEMHHEQGEHKQCANCHQEWFSSVDYSDVVQKHLSGKYIDKDEKIDRLRAELGECKGEYDRAVNKVDALREQLAGARDAFQKILDFSDSEMLDGDAARDLAEEFLSSAEPANKESVQ